MSDYPIYFPVSLLLQLLPLFPMNPRFQKTQVFQEICQIQICLLRIHLRQMFNNLSIAIDLRHHHFQALHKVFIIIMCCTKQLAQGRSYALITRFGTIKSNLIATLIIQSNVFLNIYDLHFAEAWNMHQTKL